MQSITKILIFCIAIFLCNIQAQAASFQGLGEYNFAEDISLDGSNVVGYNQSSVGRLAFLWTQNDGLKFLGDLSGGEYYSAAYNVSTYGSEIVGYSQSGSGREAFLWTQNDGMDGIGDLPGGEFDSIAYGISASGHTVVGQSRSASGTEAFVWTNYGGMVGLGDLPGGGFDSAAYGISIDGSTIVGSSLTSYGYEAFVWTQESGMVGLGDLPGGAFNSSASGVSADGSIVIGRSYVESGTEAFIWTQSSGMIGLGDLPGGSFTSVAKDVSADGSIVVGWSHSSSGDEAFIWDNINGMRSLKEVLTNKYALDLTGWTLSAAYGISGNGKRIVGVGKNPAGYDEAWIADIGKGIRVYGEFTGYIDDLYGSGPETFSNEIGPGTLFNCTFSYDPDMPIVYYSGGPIYEDDRAYIECTFFGNTQEHHVAGNNFRVTIGNGTFDYFSYYNIENYWNGLLAGSQITEGGLSLTDSTGTVFDDNSIPTSLDLGDFDGTSFWIVPIEMDSGILFDIHGTLYSLNAQLDNCPNDPNKSKPGVCGCGVPDTDSCYVSI